MGKHRMYFYPIFFFVVRLDGKVNAVTFATGTGGTLAGIHNLQLLIAYTYVHTVFDWLIATVTITFSKGNHVATI